jgi:hypothetical protein
MYYIVAKFSKVGVESRVFKDLSPKEIIAYKIDGFCVKEQIRNYRPGLYTTKAQFLAAPGFNF